MKKNILFIVIVIQTSFLSMHAQVGINTDNPKGAFHIDAKSNTPSNATNDSNLTVDDITISNSSGNEGNLGIGNINPEAKLHIVTGGISSAPKVELRIVDGNESDGRLLTSDVDGNVTWKDPSPLPTAVATRVGANIPSNSSLFYNTKSYIDLPPGRWKVTATILISVIRSGGIHDKIFAHSLFSESSVATGNGSLISGDIESGKQMASLLTKNSYNVMVGNTIIKNKSAATKRYYYFIGAFQQLGTTTGNVTFSTTGGSGNAENSIVAVLIQD